MCQASRSALSEWRRGRRPVLLGQLVSLEPRVACARVDGVRALRLHGHASHLCLQHLGLSGQLPLPPRMADASVSEVPRAELPSLEYEVQLGFGKPFAAHKYFW